MAKPKEKYLHDKPLNTFSCEHAFQKAKLYDMLNSLREEGDLLDISLVIEGTVFRAHRVVLAACSDYFRAMFTGNMLEAKQNEICLNGFTATGFHQLLEYAYTSRLTLNIANVQDVLEAASHIQMVHVIRECSGYLQAQIDIDNCLDIANIAETYSLAQLRKKVYRFITGHLLEVSKTSEFHRLTPQQLENLLSFDFLVDCSEADVLRIVLDWFFQGDANEIAVRVAHAVHIIRYIRFTQISKKNLYSILDKALENEKYEGQLYRLILQEVSVQSAKDKSKFSSNLLNPRGMEMAIIKIGGFLGDDFFNDISYCFSIGKKWNHLASMAHVSQRDFGTAVVNNELYIVGGCFNRYLRETILSFGLKYSPRYDKWSTIAPMNIKRCRFSLNVVDDLLYAVGGVSKMEKYHTNTSECYNPMLDSWYTIQPLPAYVRQHAGATYENNGVSKLYISGGIDEDDMQNYMFCYDTQLKKWESCAPMLKPRAAHVMLSIGKYLYVCGGWTGDIKKRIRVLADTIDVYDVEKDCWEEVTHVPIPLANAGIVCVDQKIYFVGGYGSNYTYGAPLEYYDINSGQWTIENKYPQDNWDHVCGTLYVPKCREDMNVIP